jgi:hypothetical protein
MSKIPLGLHGALRGRNPAQRTAVLEASRAVLDKGGDLIMREDIFWSDVQPTESGGYDWTIPDGIARDCADHGFRMFWVLSHPPTWATAPGAPDANYSWPCPPYPGLVTQGGNSALAAYAAFCGAAAARYGPGGDFWQEYDGTDRPTDHFEVWNEEYVTSSSKRWVAGTLVEQYSQPDLYAKIYNAAADAIYATPGALPVAALCDKTWNSGTPGAAYLDTFLAYLGRPLGGVSIHPYTLGYVPASFIPPTNADRWKYFTQVADVRAKLDAAGYKSVQLHITEIGWPNQPGQMTEEQQASRFTDLWTTVQGLGYVKSLIIFTTTNPDLPDNPALPGYSTDQYNFYGLWHTGSTNHDLGGAKAAVGVITSLPALTSGDPIVDNRTETYFTLDGPLLALINDSDEDAFTDPDQRGHSGRIFVKMEVGAGQLLPAIGLNPPKALEVSEEMVFTVTDDGHLEKNGGPARLLACTSIFHLERPFQYRIKFDVYLRGVKRRINPFSFIAPDSDRVLRIAEIQPVPSLDAEGITKGDDGPPGKTLHWEEVVGGYQQFDDDGNSYGVVVAGLTLLDSTSIDGGTAESSDIIIVDGGTA